MNANEIVRALRACNRSKGHRCSECPIFSRYEHRTCKATVDKAAADLIESLQAELARVTKIRNDYATAARAIALWLDDFCDRTLPYSKMIAEAARRADAALKESQRREKAMVEFAISAERDFTDCDKMFIHIEKLQQETGYKSRLIDTKQRLTFEQYLRGPQDASQRTVEKTRMMPRDYLQKGATE